MRRILVPLTGRSPDRLALATAFRVAEQCNGLVDGLCITPHVAVHNPAESGLTYIPSALLAQFRKMGSFAQRYVKRHVPVRERAKTRRLRWFLSPDFKAVFGATAAGIRNLPSDTSHR
jgi:hypothetical protein